MSGSSQILRYLITITLFAISTVPAMAQGRITGTVLDNRNMPIAEASVRAESQRSADTRETITDSEGRFSMLGLQSGQWTFIFSADGHNSSSGTATIAQAQNSPLNITLERIQYDLLVGLSDKALEGLDPEEIEREINAAHDEYTAGNWELALAGYTSVLQRLPELSELLIYVGRAHRGNGENEKALAAYARLLDVDPTHEFVETEIARTRMAMGNFEAAAAELESIANGADATREDLFNLGEVAFVKGDFDTAMQWYNKAAISDPNWVLPIFKIALIMLNRGDFVSAKEFFVKVIDVAPDSEEAVQAQATLEALP